MRIRMTKTAARAVVVSATVVAGAGFGALSAHAAEAAPAAPTLNTASWVIHTGNAPQCIETSVGTDGWAWDTQTATNDCSQAYRVKLEWAVASSDCQTLQPGDSMTYEVLKPAWAEGADLC